MNGGNLFTVLLSTIRSRFAAVTSRIRLWTSWSYINSRIITKIRQFFTGLFNVKPKDKDDYYTVFGWMISKKLAYAVVIILGVVSIWYIVSVKQVFAGSSNSGIRTYKYNSVQLRMAKEKVRILGKSGYLAYEGDVDGGYVSGTGTLYHKDGSLLYQGQFEKNKFEGNGKLYYPDGLLSYEGAFHDNLFDGEGRQYREGGSLLYTGNFVGGKKSGEGILYGSNNSMVYQGLFANDEVVYATFLDKSTEEIRTIYGGNRRIWQDDESFCVYMSDIGAMYSGLSDAGSLDDEVKAESVYVISDSFPAGESRITDLQAMASVLGNPIYEGNSLAIFPEAVVINILNESGVAFSGEVEMNSEEVFSDVISVTDYVPVQSVYLTSYKSNGLIYTFVSEARDGKFAFYSMSKAEESAQ